MPQAPETHRLFFALWPAATQAEQIRQAVANALQGVDGKRVHVLNYHITLVFYGRADADGLACLSEAADAIRGQAFQLTFDQLGYWSKPKVVWLAPKVIPQPLITLQADLSQTLVDKCGYQAEKRPYRPHLTLTRKSKRGPEVKEIESIVWQVKRFALVQSITRAEGVEYRLLKERPLD